MVFVLIAVVGAVVAWRVTRIGSYYVYFYTGIRAKKEGQYEVWRRQFGGFNTLHGSYPTKVEAFERVAWLKDHQEGIVRHAK